MKKIFLFLALCLFIAINLLGQNNPNRVTSSNWQFAGHEGLSVGTTMFHSIASSPSGQPYIAFSDDGLSSKVSVLKFDGTNWIPVGPLGFSAGPASCTSLAFSPAGQPFLAFRDGALEEKATLMKYDGSAWVNVGIPGFTPGDARDISLAFGSTGVPYIAFVDLSDSSKAAVMKFDNSNWINVGSSDFSCTYAQLTNIAFGPSGELYLAYDNATAGNAAVKKFDGTNWNDVGGSGISHDIYAMGFAIAPTGEPYIACAQMGDTIKGIVEKFNGTDWEQVGTAPFSMDGAGDLRLLFREDGVPYVVYSNWFQQKANVSKFDGTQWVHEGNVNFSPASVSYLGISFNAFGQPFVVFADGFDTSKTSVMYYPDDSIIRLYVSGTVIDSVSHLPIANHPVIIDNDTMNGSVYPHHRIVYTDVHGVYNDTIILPASVIPWRLIVRTYDCNHNQYYFETGYYTGPPVIQHDFSIYSCGNSSCQAQFVACLDTVSPLTFHFVDQSGGNINSWYWSFGDFTSSTEKNPTHTYLHAGQVYHVCLMVADSLNSCCDVYCMDVIPGDTSCQANFYSYSDSTGTISVVHFFDSSTGKPTSWDWNFGDPLSGISNISTLQNALHIFSNPGTYIVCLTISGSNCSSSYCQNLVIPDSLALHQLYGQVFAGNFPLQLGLAMIFSLDTNQNTVPYIDISTIDSSGVYYFTQVADGNYVIHATPIEPVGYLPTYYGDVITWEQATNILLSQPNNPYNIHLVAADSMVSGPGSASGQINTGKITSSMIDKITMTLLDVNYHPVSFSRVLTDGGFDFSALGYGTYYLHPELAGITSDLVKIEISAAKPHVDVIMTFTGDRILGIDNIKSGTETITIYPNPVTDQLMMSINLKASGKISFDVFRINGQLVLSTVKNVNSGISTVTLPFSGLNEGMYIVKIHSEDGINVVRRIVKSR